MAALAIGSPAQTMRPRINRLPHLNSPAPAAVHCKPGGSVINADAHTALVACQVMGRSTASELSSKLSLSTRSTHSPTHITRVRLQAHT